MGRRRRTRTWLSLRTRLQLRSLRRRELRRLTPAGPPLERVAADLRRLLADHEQLWGASDVVTRGGRLLALEVALTDCALDAARALGCEASPRVEGCALPRPQLRVLLHQLCACGLDLPVERFAR